MADRAAATARSAVCPIAGRPAAQTTWGRCLLACAPDLKEDKIGCLYEPVFYRLVRGLSPPLRCFDRLVFREKRNGMGNHGTQWKFLGKTGQKHVTHWAETLEKPSIQAIQRHF
jgi:hypothetical protein